MGKEQIPPEEQENFDFIFSEEVDKTSVEKTLQKINHRNKIIVLLLFVVVVSGFYFYQYQSKSSLDYLGGNVLRLSAGGTGVEAPEVYVLEHPWLNTSFSSALLYRPLLSTDATFTEVNTTGQALCSEYSVSSEGLTYTLTLHENIFWSDGVAITLEDVVFSFETFLKSSPVNTNLETAFLKIKGAEAWKNGTASSLEGLSLEGDVLTITLTSRYNTFLMMLTQFCPLPKHILEEVDPAVLSINHEFFQESNPVVNGMYQIAGRNDKEQLEYERNPYYEGTVCDIEKVVLHWDHPQVDLDYHTTNSYTEMVSYRGMKGFVEYDIEVLFYRYFIFNPVGSDAVVDVRVRQAVNHAMDIGAMFQEIYRNAGTLLYGGQPSVATEEVYPYDPELARALLEEAGYDFDYCFTIAYYYSDQISLSFLEGVKEYLEAVGMTVELKFMEIADLYDAPTYDMMLKGLSAFNSEDWYNEYRSNYVRVLLGEVEEFGDLVDDVVTASTEEAVQAVQRGLVELEQSLLYKIPLFTLKQVAYINGNRIYVPEGTVFGNSRYLHDFHLEDWYIKKG